MDNQETNQIESGNSLIETDKSQSIAKKQAEIARLRQLENKAQSAIKVVIGGAMLSHAVKDKNFARTLIEVLEKSVTRDNDLSRINPTLNNLREKIGLPKKELPQPKKDSDKSTPATTQATENKPATTIPTQPQNTPQPHNKG